MKIIKKENELKNLYEKGEKVVLAKASTTFDIEYPLFTEEGLVYDVEKIPLYTVQICKITYIPSGFYYGDKDSGVYDKKAVDNIKVPPSNGFYLLQTINDGIEGEINKKHARKRYEAYQKWFKSLKWVEKNKDDAKIIEEYLRKIFEKSDEEIERQRKERFEKRKKMK